MSEWKKEAMTTIAEAAASVMELKPSRERSLVLTKLDEALMWAERCPDDA